MSNSAVLTNDSENSTMKSIMGVYSSAKEKWDASGGNEMLGKVTSQIPDSTKNYVGSMFKREHIRSLKVFFGLGEERPFYFEKTPSLLTDRLRHNFTFFYLNYLFISAILFVLSSITSMHVLFGMVLLGGAWMTLLRMTEGGHLVISSVRIPRNTATAGFSALSIVYVFWLFYNTFFWSLVLSALVCTVHAFFRDASLHKDIMEDAVTMEGDLQMGEDASFLNAQV